MLSAEKPVAGAKDLVRVSDSQAQAEACRLESRLCSWVTWNLLLFRRDRAWALIRRLCLRLVFHWQGLPAPAAEALLDRPETRKIAAAPSASHSLRPAAQLQRHRKWRTVFVLAPDRQIEPVALRALGVEQIGQAHAPCKACITALAPQRVITDKTREPLRKVSRLGNANFTRSTVRTGWRHCRSLGADRPGLRRSCANIAEKPHSADQRPRDSSEYGDLRFRGRPANLALTR